MMTIEGTVAALSLSICSVLALVATIKLIGQIPIAIATRHWIPAIRTLGLSVVILAVAKLTYDFGMQSGGWQHLLLVQRHQEDL